MKLNSQLTIQAPADRVWTVLAHDFADIGKWASGVDHSKVNQEAAVLPGATVGGRVCAVPGFGDIVETFTAYDEAGKTFTYEAVGMPFFVRSAQNSWTVRAIDEATTHVRFQAEMSLLPVIGSLMAIPMKRQLTTLLANATEELKYFVETGQVHPRKQRRVAKAAKTAVAH